MAKILKFGGSSMANIENVLKAIDHNLSLKEEGLGIVVSAIGKTTNNLQAMINNPDDVEYYKNKIIEEHKIANTILSEENMVKFVEEIINPYLDNAIEIIEKGNITDKEKADINASGEKISYRFLSECLNKRGIKNIKLDSGKLIHTENGAHLDAECDFISTEKACKEGLCPLLKNGEIVCITGYYGTNKDGEVATLGRNASDTIAAIVGTCCGVDEVIIYTDVNGIYSDDPNADSSHPKVKLKKVSIDEMFLAAHTGGASVLHAKVLDFMLQMRKIGHSLVPLSVKDSKFPEELGTKIVEDKTEGVKFLIKKENQVRIKIKNTDIKNNEADYIEKIKNIFSEENIDFESISSKDTSISFLINKDEFYNKKDEIISGLQEFGLVEQEEINSLYVVGYGEKTLKNLYANSIDYASMMISWQENQEPNGVFAIQIHYPSRNEEELEDVVINISSHLPNFSLGLV